jgi:hypothetical protein
MVLGDYNNPLHGKNGKIQRRIHKLPSNPMNVNEQDLQYASQTFLINLGDYVVFSATVKVGVGVGGKLIESLKSNK